MHELKPISHKEFNEFIKGKGFKERNNCATKDLKAKFSFKPLFERRVLVVSLKTWNLLSSTPRGRLQKQLA